MRMMHRLRVVTSIKPPWILSVLQNETAFSCGRKNSFALPPSTARTITRAASIAKVEEPKKSWTERIFTLGGFLDLMKYKRQLIGYNLYEDITETIDFNGFFADFKLPDTFYSWFVVMELHLWMLMLRYMAEGKPGHEIRNNIVEAMWADMNERKSKLQNANVISLKKQTKELSQQFTAAIVGYDEGIMSDDKVLAGALWRRIFQCECNNPEHLEQLVLYVRKSVNELDRIPGQELLRQRKTPWLDYRNSQM